MRLYYAPGACSLSPHIVAREAGIQIELEKVDLKKKKTETGRDYLTVNPKGYVPALELDDGRVLTEGPAIVQYLADLNPASGLAPAYETFERYRLQEALGFINSEIHKAYAPLFNPQITPEAREQVFDRLRMRYAYSNETLAGKSFLLGEQFTAADAYLFVMLRWCDSMGPDISRFENLKAFQRRVADRPAVVAALKAEGLLG